MKYRNTKTGRLIDVKSVISGGNWQAIEPANSIEKKRGRSTGRKAEKK